MKKMTQEQYDEIIKRKTPPSKLFSDCLKAFLVGGLICAIGQAFSDLYTKVCGMDRDSAAAFTSVTLIFLSALLTGLGVYQKIAKFAGAGTVVPITGFANSVVSPALDSQTEGLILGTGAKIFTIAGPVILYGTLSSFAAGIIYCFIY